MGTYTTNKNLFMPTVGEQGWGTLVNENFETIDNFLKPITVSGSTYTFTGNQTGGTITATKITNSGTLTNTGKITANGGVGTTSLTTSSTITSTGKITGNGGIAGTTGTFSGAVTGASFNGATITSTEFNGVILKNTFTVTPTNTFFPIPYDYGPIAILPIHINNKYTGSLTYKNTSTATASLYYTRIGTDTTVQSLAVNANSSVTISFTNIYGLLISGSRECSISIPNFS